MYCMYALTVRIYSKREPMGTREVFHILFAIGNQEYWGLYNLVPLKIWCHEKRVSNETIGV
jgi:hypothetical protein